MTAIKTLEELKKAFDNYIDKAKKGIKCIEIFREHLDITPPAIRESEGYNELYNIIIKAAGDAASEDNEEENLFTHQFRRVYKN